MILLCFRLVKKPQLLAALHHIGAFLAGLPKPGTPVSYTHLTHLSRLLNGRQELTDQHKAMLDAALDKFLPDALTAKVDYVRIRFPTQDVRYVIKDVPVSYTHLDVYKRQYPRRTIRGDRSRG